ncbi:D-sedoheptulose-7-phosphate isomerase [Marinobacterium arenosum]|uniref:D-sedoheptulose-7-phosphate isomerase n=1 Tax=Marinobacterium arenosum TaxID=2862496 RepID=UPI001C975387|nr:SIS domain-containing protein [Marinobacterium arenosum]MBY4677388.1 SIS domain-containing protein [Marinobacterium arenosum]
MADNDDILASMYPFMAPDQPAAPRDKSAGLQDSIQLKVQQSLAAKQAFFAKYSGVLAQIAEAIAESYRNGGRLLTAGNGGSSCDSAHLALEFMHPVTAGRPALPAINLSQDNAMLTAVANDIGFQHVLPRQLLALAKPEDLLVVFSTSGNSANITAAVNKAKQLGLSVVAFSGGDGGELAQSSNVDHCLIVETDSVHRIQECHLVCYHILWDLVHTLLADERGYLGEHGR